MIKPKPCKFCGSSYHQSFQCRLKPKKERSKSKKTNLAVKAKPDKKALWDLTVAQWKIVNPDEGGYWFCHYCGEPLTEATLTLDHIKNRSSYKSMHMKYDVSNLVACCSKDNILKGSVSYERFVAKYYPHLVKTS
ncbi:HNHc domain containing protein [uncultured Caudovirales phage]|uniref:HNHc domain containing protein n=1 Tax=uncultured Caudovirales phage TaxID=2100421 RepID=A0A6J5N4E7_9CAUD|nr:HNHc domain containing protein [uncultured Caudovirales phage]